MWTLGLELLGKRARGECMSASLLSYQDVNTALPVEGIYVDGTWYLALIDTGCSRTIVDADLGGKQVWISRRLEEHPVCVAVSE